MADAKPTLHKTGQGAAICVANDLAAAEAGAAMLRRGGNAFDAAVAAGFMEAVVSPHNCGIGGYGASGIGYLAGPKRLVAIDGGAVAPARSAPDMFPIVPTRDPNDYRFLDARHKRGPLSVPVPGVLGGLLRMLETYGRLDRRTVMGPAIEQARAGVRLTPGQALTWLTLKAQAEGRPAPKRAELPQVVPMQELAASLELIAREGAEAFYSGPIGRAIADHVSKLGGILSREDMAGYHAKLVEPVTVKLGDRTLATPPPASGGLTSLQFIALFDRLKREGKAGDAGSVPMLHATIEIDKVVWEDRLMTLGDAETMSTPPQTYLDAAHLDKLYARVLEGIAHPGPGRLVAPDPLRGTVHLAAADSEGNAVSWTQTHGGGYGANVMVPGTEIVLGHGMCRFEPRPGWPNSVAPGKRPLHNMCPVIAVRDGRAELAIGGSGGRTIVNNCAAVAVRQLLYGMDPLAADEAPRVQCESLEPVVIERKAGADVIAALKARGHLVKETTRDAGSIHLIAREGNTWSAAAEPHNPTACVVVA